MIHPAAKRKIRTATFIVFVLFTLAILFSTGEDSSIFSIFIMSIYFGLLVSTIFFILISIITYIITLVSGWLNN